MELLKTKLNNKETRGVVKSTSGDVRFFNNKGVKDLFNLITQEPNFLIGGMIADRVIGKGAALLLVKAQIRQVYAEIISQTAYNTLVARNIDVTYNKIVPYIINQNGTDTCPVEKLTKDTESADEAYILIKEFLEKLNK